MIETTERRATMQTRKEIAVEMGPCWQTYVSSAFGALRAAHYWENDVSLFMVLSGRGFPLIVEERCCASSVTVYEWNEEHFRALDRIGVFSETSTTILHPPVHSLKNLQEHAKKRIIESLLQEKPVVIWSPTFLCEFGLIRGFDLEDGVYFVTSIDQKNPDPLLFENLGFASGVNILHYQILHSVQSIAMETMLQSSLEYAQKSWNQECSSHPRYKKGKKGYDTWIQALTTNQFDSFGLRYLLAVYGDNRLHLASGFQKLQDFFPKRKTLQNIAELYQQVADLFAKMREIAPFSPPSIPSAPLSSEAVQLLHTTLEECKTLESKAMQIISTQ
jgi:hypothetical protein